jgi:hypothetical protein
MESERTFFRRRGLLAAAVIPPLLETGLLVTFGPRDAAPLGPQVTAPPPFDLFHDLRWIFVYHNSWWLLALELTAALVLRSLYIAFMVQQAWPSGRPPGMRAAIRRILVFYAIASVLLFPWIVLLFGMALTHVSYLFFAALPPALGIALIIHRGALSQAIGQWWRWGPSWSSLLWLAAAFVWLTLAGGVVATAPLPLALASAGLAGLLNARSTYAVARSITVRPVRVRVWSHRLVPVAVATLLAVAVGGAAIGFADTTRHIPPEQSAVRIPSGAVGHPVLVAAGFGSRWNPSNPIPLPKDFVGWQYSYRGVDAAGRILPYRPEDTLQPLMVSAATMAEEVDALYQAFGEPVTIVAGSEGALVARTYLLRLYRPVSREVDLLVVLDLPVGRSSVWYPRRGNEGWGVATGWGLRGLATLIRGLGPLTISADAPVVRNLADCRSLVASLEADPAPAGVKEVSFRALADAVAGVFPPDLSPRETYVITATHGTLSQREAVQALIGDVLNGVPDRASSSRMRLARVLSALSAPWHVPSLASGLAPASTC